MVQEEKIRQNMADNRSKKKPQNPLMLAPYPVQTMELTSCPAGSTLSMVIFPSMETLCHDAKTGLVLQNSRIVLFRNYGVCLPGYTIEQYNWHMRFC
jgi:hypothetical protein